MSLYTINSKFPIVSFFRITRLGSAALASTTHDEYILFHIGNDNIFSVRFSFEINYNFFLCYFPYGFVAPSTIRQPEQEENVIKKCCTTGSVVFSHFFCHTHCSPRLEFSFSGKRPSLLLITAIISSLLFTPKNLQSMNFSCCCRRAGAHSSFCLSLHRSLLRR